MHRKLWKVKIIGILAVALVMLTAVGVAEQYAERNDMPYVLTLAERTETADELTGAWRTAEEDEDFITLLLYPADAFRLYQYHEDDDETFMLEGVRVVEDDAIIVSAIRLGMLDSDGVYTQTGEKDTSRFTFSLDLDGTPALTLTDEQGVTIALYPVDLDSPG